jgi:isopentenyl-diphosphate delta-isomerase
VALFLGQASPDLVLAPNPQEVMQTRWLDMSELKAELLETPDIYTPWMRIYMAEHAERIFGKNGAADDRGGNL